MKIQTKHFIFCDRSFCTRNGAAVMIDPTNKRERQNMKKIMKTTLAILALGTSAFAVSAQDDNGGPPPGGPGGRHHRPPPLPIITALDANHDGMIDADEIANASAALLTLDKNADGVLTTNEYLPPIPADAPKGAHHPPVPPVVKALDANGDGVIDAGEIANAPAALKTLDKNGDGKLTQGELRPPHPPHPPGDADDGDDNMHGPPPGGGDDGGNHPPAGPPTGDN